MPLFGWGTPAIVKEDNMKLLTSFVLVGLSMATHAFDYRDVQIWAGEGSQRTIVVMDFQSEQGISSFAWGIRWDGAFSGADALEWVQTADQNLTIDILGTGESRFVNSMAYRDPRSGETLSGPVWPTGWWSYWTGTASSWQSSNVGMGQSPLVADQWEGWSYNLGTGFNPPAPREPIAAVPEPATLIGIAAGLTGLLRSRRTRLQNLAR